jgi:S1-C subfamily serine protease
MSNNWKSIGADSVRLSGKSREHPHFQKGRGENSHTAGLEVRGKGRRYSQRGARKSGGGEAGLRRGDVIQEVNRHSVRNLYDYNGALEKAKKDRIVFLLVNRGGGALYVVLKSVSKS